MDSFIWGDKIHHGVALPSVTQRDTVQFRHVRPNKRMHRFRGNRATSQWTPLNLILLQARRHTTPSRAEPVSTGAPQNDPSTKSVRSVRNGLTRARTKRKDSRDNFCWRPDIWAFPLTTRELVCLSFRWGISFTLGRYLVTCVIRVHPMMSKQVFHISSLKSAGLLVQQGCHSSFVSKEWLKWHFRHDNKFSNKQFKLMCILKNITNSAKPDSFLFCFATTEND